MQYTRKDLENKIDALREDWKTASEKDRKLIEKRAHLLKIALLKKPMV